MLSLPLSFKRTNVLRRFLTLAAGIMSQDNEMVLQQKRDSVAALGRKIIERRQSPDSSRFHLFALSLRSEYNLRAATSYSAGSYRALQASLQ
jgi:hypothetical protein